MANFFLRPRFTDKTSGTSGDADDPVPSPGVSGGSQPHPGSKAPGVRAPSRAVVSERPKNRNATNKKEDGGSESDSSTSDGEQEDEDVSSVFLKKRKKTKTKWSGNQVV